MRPTDTSREHFLGLSTDLDLRRRFMVLKDSLRPLLRHSRDAQVAEDVIAAVLLRDEAELRG
jgi:hypothetical protein